MAERCPLLHTGPACSRTYAEELGGAYSVLQVLFIFFAVLLFSLATLFVRLVTARKGWVQRSSRGHLKLDLQQVIMYTAWGAALLQMLRCIDPFGWRLWLPLWLVNFCYDVVTFTIFSMIYAVGFSWLVATNRQLLGNMTLRGAYRGSQVVICVAYLVLSLSESLAGPLSDIRAAKALMTVLMLGSVSIFTLRYGVEIYGFLRSHHEEYIKTNLTAGSSQSISVSESSEDLRRSLMAPRSAAETDPSRIPAAGGGRQQHQFSSSRAADSERRLRQILRVRNFLVALVVITAIGLVVFSVELDESLRVRRTLDDGGPAPTPAELAATANVDAFHFIGLMGVLWFFSASLSEKKEASAAEQPQRQQQQQQPRSARPASARYGANGRLSDAPSHSFEEVPVEEDDDDDDDVTGDVA